MLVNLRLLSIGAGIFVITIVAGSVMLTQNFKSMERPILRDILFYMLATFLTWCIFYSEKVHLWQAICKFISRVANIDLQLVVSIVNCVRRALILIQNSILRKFNHTNDIN